AAPINTANAAAGDPFRAKLLSPIKTKQHQVLAPKGAIVTGRIIRIERFYEAQSLALSLKLESIGWDGVPHPFAARLVSSVERRHKAADALVVQEDLGTFDQIATD